MKEIDLKVKKGEFICLVGAVGSGKTSLLNVMNENLIYVPDSLIEREKDKVRTNEDL